MCVLLTGNVAADSVKYAVNRHLLDQYVAKPIEDIDMFVAVLANLVGSSIAYAVGRYGGRALFMRYGKYVGISAHHMDKADQWFVRYGPATVFFTRMMPGVRTFISLPAGIAKMPVVKFLLYSAVGSAIWNTALAYLGYGFYKALGADGWNKLQDTFHRYNRIWYVVLAVVVVAIIAFVVWSWRRHRSRAASQESSKS